MFEEEAALIIGREDPKSLDIVLQIHDRHRSLRKRVQDAECVYQVEVFTQSQIFLRFLQVVLNGNLVLNQLHELVFLLRSQR